jgi:AraC family transcriptional regulator
LSVPGTHDFRRTIHRSSLVSVEDASVGGESAMPSGYESAHQIVLPYFGLFAYAVGRQRWLVDSNKVLFIAPGWEFSDEQPVAALGHATVLINPARGLVDELTSGRRNPGFPAGTVRSSPWLQLITQTLLRHSLSGADPLRGDELAVRAIRLAMSGIPPRGRPSARTVDRAKQFLHAHDCERLCLEQVANAVGVSPVYLTQEFKRSEGIPLYQYQLALRLARALVELPHANDITLLALDLGFSSHSHFTLAFRKAFGVTPSEYRRAPGPACAAA